MVIGEDKPVRPWEWVLGERGRKLIGRERNQ
jgi:hypothetical protein